MLTLYVSANPVETYHFFTFQLYVYIVIFYFML